jgi:hypothetical protein
MPRCAFLTIEHREGWFIDDELVHEPLRNLGWEIIDVVWNAEVDWNAFDVVVIRSPWDYQQNVPQFLSVLQRINDSSATLYNPLEIVRVNLDKEYLFDLQRSDIEIVPTLRLEAPAPEDVQNVFRHFDSEHLVFKPTKGANADDTYRVSRQTPETEIVMMCEVFSTKACLAQPFMHGIVTEGEFSLIYFNGRLSHSIIKTPKTGDFRVQEEHGGGVVWLDQPDPKLIVAGDRALATLPESPLYARLDFVRTHEGAFAVMELELIEPCLYFRFGEGSAQAFAQAIADRYARENVR